jgi:hypothetical protein
MEKLESKTLVVGGRGPEKTTAHNAWLNEKELKDIIDVRNFFEEIKCESDEDSCMGAAFFNFRSSEDWFYSCKNALDRIIKRHSLTTDVPDTQHKEQQ